MMELDVYNRKRDFEKTPEPQGEASQSGAGLRFVVQHHRARRDHYDFRLEWNGVLLSWAVPKGPSYNTRDKRLAVQVEDHPLEYRHFEGTIPKGEYGGGVVMLWDEGFWEPFGNVDEGLRDGSLKFILKGTRLKGKWALVRMKTGETRQNWLLLKERDPYAQTDDGVSDFTTSIRTGRTMAEIEAGEGEKFTRNPFHAMEVQLLKLVHAVPEEADWLYELKYDGYRIVAFVEANGVRLVTRNGNDYTERFPDIAASLLAWASGRAMVLDGEMVIVDAEGRTDFQALQKHMKNAGLHTPTYIVFDLLALDGADLRERRLIERKELLETLMQGAPPNLYYSRHIEGNGKESFGAACAAHLEGIVGKRADSVYSGTRNGDWVKLRCGKRQEFVIGGYTLSSKKTSGVSSLLLGVYEGAALVYAGRAGTGMRKADQESLEALFQNIRRAEPPFSLAPKPRSNETVLWLEPELVAEIQFAEWTEENLLRQASFKGLRADKRPEDIQREVAEDAAQGQACSKEVERPMETERNALIVQGIPISNPDKVMFDDPKVTKADVVRYYEKVASRMLPYVSHRIMSIVRCPKGIAQTCFYKKHPGPESKGIRTVAIPTNTGDLDEYFYIEEASGLIAEVQMGTLEFHIWGSRVYTLEKPDMMVFDLDPDEGMDLGQVRRGVNDLKGILSELSLSAYLKTSGGKGYHVVVPMQPAASWEAFHGFARRIAEVMEQKWPDRYTSNVRKAKRTGKIFIDWIRNGRGATSIAPYSIRARKGARVSMPIAWEELDTVAPDGIRMEDALARIEGPDPWGDFDPNHQRLK